MNLSDRLSVLLKQDRKFRRRQLKQATPQEDRLWKEVLRKYKAPCSFIWKWALIPRNHLPVDFYSPGLLMTVDVETDAESRGELSLHESNRRTFLRRYAVYPLFVSESEIDRDLDAVRARIDREIRNRAEWIRQRNRERAETGETGIPEKRNENTDPGSRG